MPTYLGPDANLVIDDDGNVTFNIGYTVRVDVAQAYAVFETYRASGNQSTLAFNGARGTIASPTVSLNDDQVMRLSGRGYSAAAGAFIELAAILFRVDGTPDSGGDTSDMPGTIEFWVTPEGSEFVAKAAVISNSGNVGIEIDDPLARLHILQSNLGSAVQILESSASGDNPIEATYQNGVNTTNATPTTLHTIPIPANNTVVISARVIARRTGGAAGTANDGAAYIKTSAYTTKAGVVTLLGSALESIDRRDVAGYTCELVISGTNVIVQVTGVANTNITWHLLKCEVSQVGS